MKANECFKTNLKDLLHCINVLGEDFDVCVEGNECIAVCPPVKFTRQGLYHFITELEANVNVFYKNGSHDYTIVDDKKQSINDAAYKMLAELAGSCSKSNYDTWFNGENAQLI